MTNRIGSSVTSKLLQRIAGPSGVNSGIAAMSQGNPAFSGILRISQVRSQNLAPDMADRSSVMQYPSLNVYCEKIVNNMAEKFRTFSGAVQMAIEIRHSQDRLDGLQDALEFYADAAIETLNASRGDWSDGMFYTGEYQVAFGAVKHGGKNFQQIAKITFEIGVSTN
jgi:hypothetical protein